MTTTSSRAWTAARRLAHAAEVRASRAERVLHHRLMAFGNRVECPVCGWSGQRFGPSRRPRRTNRLCPGCGSSERDRALHLWLDGQLAVEKDTLCEVAPIGLVRPQAERLGFAYCSVDLFSPRAAVRGDLCRLPFADRSISVLLCFHVLEHVHDDRLASAEIARVLRDGGTAVISVPWDPSSATTDEDLNAGPEERLRRFGQDDHVRMYGRDLGSRFSQGGLDVEVGRWSELFTPSQFAHAALDGDDDRFWFCTPRR